MPNRNHDDDVWTTPEEWQEYVDATSWEAHVTIIRSPLMTNGWALYEQLVARRFFPRSAA